MNKLIIKTIRLFNNKYKRKFYPVMVDFRLYHLYPDLNKMFYLRRSGDKLCYASNKYIHLIYLNHMSIWFWNHDNSNEFETIPSEYSNIIQKIYDKHNNELINNTILE